MQVFKVKEHSCKILKTKNCVPFEVQYSSNTVSISDYVQQVLKCHILYKESGKIDLLSCTYSVLINMRVGVLAVLFDIFPVRCFSSGKVLYRLQYCDTLGEL